MRTYKIFFRVLLLLLFTALQSTYAQTKYNIYFGNTHAHCNYSGDIVNKAKEKSEELDPQNTAETIFRLAKESGYDFYAMTDHSQYEAYTIEAFADISNRASAITDNKFIAITGFEFSRNANTDGKGHINVYNTPHFVSAENMGMEDFQNWLTLAENEGAIACFNHPELNAYKNFQLYNKPAQEKFSMIELINGSNAKLYERFLTALSKGWRVSPVAGCDNHKRQGVKSWKARTGVASTALTHDALMEAFAHRRTYATFDKNLKVMYYVESQPMGSVIKTKQNKLEFNIEMSSTDNIISKVDIIGTGGKIIDSKEFSTDSISWNVKVDGGEDYYFLMVYENGSQEPVAWIAPVWIEK